MCPVKVHWIHVVVIMVGTPDTLRPSQANQNLINFGDVKEPYDFTFSPFSLQSELKEIHVIGFQGVVKVKTIFIITLSHDVPFSLH